MPVFHIHVNNPAFWRLKSQTKELVVGHKMKEATKYGNYMLSQSGASILQCDKSGIYFSNFSLSKKKIKKKCPLSQPISNF